MRALRFAAIAIATAWWTTAASFAAVPTEVEQPGTQPLEVGNLESPGKCDNCHGGYSPSVEPAHNWRGGAMAQAGRDPLFWATLAVAEQDFSGAGDFCLKCHAPDGWFAGRSTPSDGSALASGDADGVTCDTCHKLTNPDRSEHAGVQNAPYLAYDETTGAAYLGSGMAVLWGGSEKLGPYQDATPNHQFRRSRFHRDAALCGTCHDVSNPVVGDLAPGNGAPEPLAAGSFSGEFGSPVDGKAAFNNFPFQYGVVERTFSEHQSGALSRTLVSSYASLPDDLKDGAIEAAYESAIVAGKDGDYADLTDRTFTCQTCHVRPVTGQGCNKNPAVRKDLPLHDMTGGNYWLADALPWLDARGLLRLGGGLSSSQKTALADGKARAQKQLASAAALEVDGASVRILNLTGHKLITGYPEGRRMWLNVKWYDAAGAVLREDGKYGTLRVSHGGSALDVETLLDLSGANTRIYEAHYAITQGWAAKLVALGVSRGLELGFDRTTGEATRTLGELADQAPGTHGETFHFALNNLVAQDNRIPPYRMSYDEARRRNALPVPASQYGAPGSGGAYDHYDEVALSPPVGASYALLALLYQPTSWEYVQFLDLANQGGNAFLADEGKNLLDVWLATGMAAPYVMASATWGTPPVPPVTEVAIGSLATYTVSKSGALGTAATSFVVGSTVGFRATTSPAASGAQLFLEIRNPSATLVTTVQGFTDSNGAAKLTWKSAKNAPKGTYSARVVNLTKSGYSFAAASSPEVAFTLR